MPTQPKTSVPELDGAMFFDAVCKISVCCLFSWEGVRGVVKAMPHNVFCHLADVLPVVERNGTRADDLLDASFFVMIPKIGSANPWCSSWCITVGGHRSASPSAKIE